MSLHIIHGLKIEESIPLGSKDLLDRIFDNELSVLGMTQGQEYSDILCHYRILSVGRKARNRNSKHHI